MTNPSKKALRKSLYINRQVQGALILKSVMQWFFYMCAVLLSVVIWTVIRDPSAFAVSLLFDAFIYFSPAILASLLILPLFLFDTLKESNRIAGPIYRLQDEMIKLANGETVGELRFRDGDHWEELATSFNSLVKSVNCKNSEGEVVLENEKEPALVD